ncbi:helix-turn-helix domain-containing protein [Adlercreutzia faecimuris]|uniref:Helix-turn-helix transcriptional regulator n=1 Tax=Adlercreutzia faecimuris TaxID=2897341 RepID=A0ABS9WFT2_9ACTN|nr:helix-turn-helix transcriptional regulator [Adlercreutzia sp. JBNU-10]MCI2241081.1 helix-turn-helix transcriptional regulator [Adlercreutzia sp. JBNU-10]
MTTFDEHLAEQMKDPEFAREWERLEPEYAVINAILDAQQELGITQSELAARCGMKQSALSRLETGKTSPTLKTLQQLADGMGKKLVIQFV